MIIGRIGLIKRMQKFFANTRANNLLFYFSYPPRDKQVTPSVMN